ncbi:MAG: GntR family transcriptional regulator [Clostridiaceae bacterium]
MAWQFTSSRPIYQQIVDEIELRILNGTYEMGMRLPSVRDLAMLAAVNPNTMQRALSELEEMGLLTTQRNAGRTVTTDEEAVKRARSAKADLLTETFLLQMKSLGLTKEEAIKRLEQGDTKEGENGRNS